MLAVVLTHTCLAADAGPAADDLMPGDEVEILGELYAYGVAEDLRTRAVALIAIVPLRLSPKFHGAPSEFVYA